MSHPYPILLFMILEAARRAETAAAALLAAVNTGTASTAELRRVLTATRSVAAAVGAAQTAAAEQIARRERHGDGGAEILAASAGLSQQEARSQVTTAAALRKVPELRDAVQSGDVPQANARRLVEAITRTSSAAVAGDAGLLAQAQSTRPEQFARTAQRWIGAHQADDGTAEHLRQRAKRYLRMHDTEDGMVRLHGEFDKITGTRIHNRLRHTASRLFDADKKLPQSDRRKFPQCMADALQHFADLASTRAVDGRSQNTETSSTRSSSSASTGGAQTSADIHNPAKEAVTNSTHSSTDAATSNRTGGDHSDRRSGDTANNNNNPVNGSTGSDCDASTCRRDDKVTTVHEHGDADSTNPATGSSTNAAANSENTASTDPGNADSDDAGCGCAQHSHSTDATTSAGPGTDPANGCRGGARTGASIHSTAADTANNASSMSGISRSGSGAQTGSGCDASVCRDGTVATVLECENADHTRPATGKGTDAAAGTDSEDTANTNPCNADSDDAGCGCAQHSHSTNAAASANIEDSTGGDAGCTDENADNSASGSSGRPAKRSPTPTQSENADNSASGGSGGWVADITVLAHVDDTTGELIGELSDGSKLPAAVLEELSCNARWSGLVFDRAGDAIWRSRSRRTVTDTQWQALLATYGGCFHCAAPAGMCQAHHITPYSQGGATSLDNLIMVCWNCHHKIHHHNWQIEKHSDGSHTLHPPDDTSTATKPRYGPACADDYPPEPDPPPRRRRRRSPDRPETKTSRARTEANHARSQPEARRT